jgi:hypothetical protein
MRDPGTRTRGSDGQLAGAGDGRHAQRRVPGRGRGLHAGTPYRQDGRPRAGRPVPARPAAVPSPSSSAAPVQDGTLVAQARRAALEYQASRGRPITRDALCARLCVSGQAASGLLRQIRSTQAT